MRRVNNKKIAKRMQDWWEESKYEMRILPQSPTSLPYLAQAKGRRLSKSKASRRELKVGERRVHIYSNRNMYCGNAKTKGRIKKQITHWGRDQSTQEDVMYTSMKNSNLSLTSDTLCWIRRRTKIALEKDTHIHIHFHPSITLIHVFPLNCMLMHLLKTSIRAHSETESLIVFIRNILVLNS